MNEFIQRIKQNRAGYVSAGAVFLFALLFLGINVYSFTKNNEYYPKYLYGGFLSLFWGIALIFFPGGKRKVADYPGGNVQFWQLWNEAPKLHRYVWMAATLLSVVVSVFVEKWLETGDF